MTSAARRKGKSGELDAAARLRVFGWPVRRRLLQGRHDDCGDLDGVPFTTVEVKSRDDLVGAVRDGLADLRREQGNAQTPYGVLLVRRRGGRFIAVMDLEQWAVMAGDAIAHRAGGEAS